VEPKTTLTFPAALVMALSPTVTFGTAPAAVPAVVMLTSFEVRPLRLRTKMSFVSARSAGPAGSILLARPVLSYATLLPSALMIGWLLSAVGSLPMALPVLSRLMV